MFDIGCIIRSYRISEGYKTALSGDLQYIIIAVNFLKVTSQQLIAN